MPPSPIPQNPPPSTEFLNTMLKPLALTAVLMLGAAPAFAWVANSAAQGPGANAATSASSDNGPAIGVSQSQQQSARSFSATRSSARSISASQGGAGGSGGTSTVNVVNSSGNTGHAAVASASAPSMLVPGPCPVYNNGSAGGQSSVFGISLGFGGDPSKVCEIATYLRDPLAKAWACRHWDGIREAARDIGQPCPQDGPITRVVPASAVPPTVPARTKDRYPFDYCYTASAGELRQHKECGDGRTPHLPPPSVVRDETVVLGYSD